MPIGNKAKSEKYTYGKTGEYKGAGKAGVRPGDAGKKHGYKTPNDSGKGHGSYSK